MKKRILSILLTLCMVLMLCPVTAFAAENYTLTLNFKYGNLVGMPQAENPYISVAKEGDQFYLPKVENCAPYELVGWKEAGSGTVYAPTPQTLFSVEADLTFDAVYQVQGSLAITVNGFEAGKTPNDCTYTFESTIPGVTFSEDDIQVIQWQKRPYFNGVDYGWRDMSKTEVFQAGTQYSLWICLDNKGLDKAPAVTVNGRTPEDCSIATSNGVPIQLQIDSTLGTPALTLTIDGPDVVCAQQDYEFTVTPPAGVTLDEMFDHAPDDRDYSYTGYLTRDEDGIGHGVVPASKYGSADSIELAVFGEAADGMAVSAAKTVQISPEHIYVDGVCGCGAVQQYTIIYDGGEDSNPITGATTSPQTGDNSHMAFWIALLFVSGGLLTATVIKGAETEQKRRKRHE